jgi:hypothetical protein
MMQQKLKQFARQNVSPSAKLGWCHNGCERFAKRIIIIFPHALEPHVCTGAASSGKWKTNCVQHYHANTSANSPFAAKGRKQASSQSKLNPFAAKGTQ